jgi:hypothetical protein
MREIPMLYSTPMVQALLDGRKTQTRRVVKPQPTKEFICGYDIHQSFTGKPSVQLFEFYDTNTDSDTSQRWPTDDKGIKCPYGKPGDLIWVRETWMHSDDLDEPYWYKASFEQDYSEEKRKRMVGLWKPSIHMPKAAARIWLQIESVSVERLQDITEEDAVAEGVETLGLYPGYDVSSRGKFEGLWYSINGPDAWDANPWVWVIKFKVVSTTGREHVKA